MGSTARDDAQPGSTERARRHRPRNSGGFLLDSLNTPSRSAQSSSSTPTRDEKEKGKRKSDEVNLAISKRRTRPGSQQDDGVRSSPLSKELRPEEWDYQDARPYQNGRPVSTQSSRPSFGHDTDPAQIVEMALRLTEGRRRQASGNNSVLSGNNKRRMVSVGNVDNAANRISSAFLGSYTGIPASQTTPRDLRNGVIDASSREDLRMADPSEVDMESDLEFSKATQARVAKAKRYMELAYEHRRLLSHLPPVRRPGSEPAPETDVSTSKVYNPLQYARNRKLRLREKAALTAEADGWYDVDKVRAWVDAAIKSYPSTEHDPIDCVRLPPLSHQTNEHDATSPSFPTSPHSNKQAVRPRRPKSDWVTHPGDLMADAYWLEQGLNKTKILDRDNYHIYPAHTQFRYAGWRQRATPTKIPDYLQTLTPPPEDGPTESRISPLSDAPELPTFKPAYRKLRDSALIRGPKRLKRAFAHANKDSRGKESEEVDSETDSSTSTSAGESASDSGNSRRGRRRYISKDTKFDLPVGNPFDRSITSARLLDNESGASSTGRDQSSTRRQASTSMERTRLSNDLSQKSHQRISILRKGRQDSEVVQSPQRYSLEQDHRTSDEYDVASPISPVNHGLPSIAINLSPPHSRSNSPHRNTSRGLSKTSHGRSASRDHGLIRRNDSPKRNFTSHSRDPSTDVDRPRVDSSNESRGNSPFSKARRGSSSHEDSPGSRLTHRQSTVSRMSTRSNVTTSEPRSRIKGIFKGGRIAEIVGTEVSRVGDYIWKRDPPGRHHHSISETSFHSRHSSETENEGHTNGTVYKTPPKDGRKSISSESDNGGYRRSHDEDMSNRRPQYYNPNLPSFTSPFQRDREKQEKSTRKGSQSESTNVEDSDHISLQVSHHRMRSKSPRLDRLAPPKLNTSANTPNEDRRKSYGFGADLTKSQSASQAFNDAIGSGSTDSLGSRKKSMANMSQNGRSSVAAMLTPSSEHKISRKDILRIRALLIMSCVKAKSILAAQETSPAKTSDAANGWVIHDTRDVRLSKCSEHVLAAREFISGVAKSSEAFDSKLNSFSKTVVAKLHGELQSIEDTIENTLTPRARVAADQAGELSMKLTTTSALATKDLNDTISEAFRHRKRGPLRFLRLFAYGAIEWAVVGLLWFIWAVVMAIRLVLGVFTGTIKVTRWLLWID